ncbi:hypothetical protein BY458DRAFT_516301 [Sporodiniella umbellata]|nr:hypothetical protein BY458DRAFT_516301 [Sporodiniella umbellata]
MASKSFNPAVKNVEDMDRWFSILAVELHNRVMLNFEEYNTWPSKFSLHHASSPFSYRSKTMGFISKDEMKDTDGVAKKLEKLFKSLKYTIPCFGIQFHASTMEQYTNSRTIKHFFTKAPTKAIAMDDNTQEAQVLQKETGHIEAKTKKDPQGSITATSTWTCDKCNINVPLKEVDEHTDFHFAYDLHQQDSPSNVAQEKCYKAENSPKKRKAFFS